MTEFSENKDDKKLDWMYRDASQIVDREEYLLGRKVDKQFETCLLPPDKNQEGLPPSIFTVGTTESQVDIARKLQEDPLYLIKKKEVEWREQLLKNPRKMKQLQEMIAKQKETAEKIKKKQLKKKKKRELDALLVKKCKKIFGDHGTRKLAELQDSDSDESSSSSSDNKSSKKKKKNKHKGINLDRALALKYKQVIGDLDAKGIAEIDSSTESSSEDESKRNLHRKKARSSSSPSPNTPKRKSGVKKKNKNEFEREKKYSNSEDESRRGNKNKNLIKNYNALKDVRNKKENYNRNKKNSDSNIKRKYRRGSSSSESSEDVCDSKRSSTLERTFDEGVVEQKKYDFNHKYNNRDRIKSYSEKEDYNRRSPMNNRYERRESEGSGMRLNLKYRKNSQQVRSKHHVKKEKSSQSSSESSSYDEEKRKNVYPSSVTKISKHEQSKCKNDSSTSSSDSSSDEKIRQPKKQYGLVLPANYVPKKQTQEEVKQVSIKKEEPTKLYRKEDKPKLTEKDKEKKLKEMMDNAKWREEQRDKNIKKYKEKEKAEKDDYVYNEDFMRKQMAIAVSQGTVESRVKANINTIQRSGSSMSEHFARRK